MTGRGAGLVLDWYGSRRRRQLESIWRDPAGWVLATLNTDYRTKRTGPVGRSRPP